MSLRNVCLGRTDLFALLAMDCHKTNCKADRTAKKGNKFIAQYFGETKLTFIRGCKKKNLFSAFRHVTIATEPLQFSRPDSANLRLSLQP